MKKELSLALLSISLALGSATPGHAQMLEFSAAETSSAALVEITEDHISTIRSFVAARDVLGLRAFLAANPALLQCATPLCLALARFWEVSNDASAVDIFGDLDPLLNQGSVGGGDSTEGDPPTIYG